MVLGEYEKVVADALRSVSTGPWTATDLPRVQEVISDDFCRSYGPECKASAVLDWLRSMDGAQREDLLFQLNAH